MARQKTVIEFPPATDSHFRMIDVGRKRPTRRRAIAAGTIFVGSEAFIRIRDKTLPKGDVLALAEAAGIIGAKKTPDMIPMCHTLPLDQVSIHCALDEAEQSVTVYCQAVAFAKTGVEMEALAGANAALLTIWDLTKGTEPGLRMEDIRLLVKEGGKSGLWIHPDGIPDWLATQLPSQKPMEGLSAALIVMSDRASSGEYEDKSGPLLREMLEREGAKILDLSVIPDDKDAITEALQKICSKSRPDLVFTSGGTGLGERDVTPEALAEICDRTVPGFGELLRRDGSNFTDLSWLSRACAGMIGQTLVITLPGSPKAVREGLESLLPVLPHAIKMIRGEGHG